VRTRSGFADLFHVLIRPPTDAESLRILISVVRNLEDRHRCELVSTFCQR
jgi:hypothetical protein